MDLNDAIERAKRARAPELSVQMSGKSVSLVDGLLSKLKTQDETDRKLMRRLMVVFGVAGLVYVLIFTLTWIAPPDTSPEEARFRLALFSMLFFSYALWVRFKARALSRIDYAKPLIAFLREAESRYRFIGGRDLLFIALYYVTFGVVGGVAWMSVYGRYFARLDPSTALSAYAGLWVVGTIIGLIMGRREWRKKKAPLLSEIRSMREELAANAEVRDG